MYLKDIMPKWRYKVKDGEVQLEEGTNAVFFKDDVTGRVSNCTLSPRTVVWPILKESDIVDEYTACPYCMNKVNVERLGCCGESSAHFCTAYETADGECFLEDDVYIEGSS